MMRHERASKTARSPCCRGRSASASSAARQERRLLDPVARQLALKCPSPDAPVSTLSGGNQQKVLLARWLLRNPDVLFLDDPTRGIDVGAKQDIYRVIDELAAAGKGVILVSSELPELLRCSRPHSGAARRTASPAIYRCQGSHPGEDHDAATPPIRRGAARLMRRPPALCARPRACSRCSAFWSWRS